LHPLYSIGMIGEMTYGKESKMNRRTVVLCLAIVFCVLGNVDASSIWTWDSGTTEGWVGYGGDTTLTIEAGRNGTYALGALNAPPYETALFPKLEVSGQSIDPTTLVGGLGSYLPLTGEIFVDIQSKQIQGHGNYLDLYIFGENSTARFNTYPNDGIGSIVDLGDGWYRYHLENLSHHSGNSGSAGTVRLEWNWNYDASVIPVVFDNLTIHGTGSPQPIPEATTMFLLVTGLVGVAGFYRKKLLKE